jgi:hypothetical protein
MSETLIVGSMEIWRQSVASVASAVQEDKMRGELNQEFGKKFTR